MGGSGGEGPVGAGEGRSSDCPRRFETRLVDVFQSGNTQYALTLQPGSLLDLETQTDESTVAVFHQGTLIGYLPPQYGVAECIRLGWHYAASVVELEEGEQVPIIKVLVIGTPS
jgi:hypothetical protein